MERAGDRGRDKDSGKEKGGRTLPVPPSPIPWPPAPLSGWADSEGKESDGRRAVGKDGRRARRESGQRKRRRRRRRNRETERVRLVAITCASMQSPIRKEMIFVQLAGGGRVGGPEAATRTAPRSPGRLRIAGLKFFARRAAGAAVRERIGRRIAARKRIAANAAPKPLPSPLLLTECKTIEGGPSRLPRSRAAPAQLPLTPALLAGASGASANAPHAPFSLALRGERNRRTQARYCQARYSRARFGRARESERAADGHGGAATERL